MTGLVPGFRGGILRDRVELPAALGWSPSDLRIREVAPGVFDGQIDVAARTPAVSQRMYVRQSAANDLGNGLTPATAKRNWWAVWNTIGATPTEVIIESGFYPLARSWSGGGAGSGLTANVIIRAADDLNHPERGGFAWSSMSTPTASWTPTGGTSHVYQLAMADVPYAVVDDRQRNAWGGGTRLILVGSVAACDATAGTYYHAAGVLYVHLLDDRPADAKVHAYPDKVNGLINIAARRVVMHGIGFRGGSRGLLLLRAQDLTVVGCRFIDSKLDGLGLSNTTDSITTSMYSLRSEVSNCGNDGFQYTATPAGCVTRFVEVDCRGMGNGQVTDGTQIHNGSTSHESAGCTVTGIRVNGIYAHNRGPNVADAGASRIAMYGTEVHTTRATLEDARVNVWAEGETYLDGCRVWRNGVDLRAQPGATIRHRGTSYRSTVGTIARY